MSIVFLSVRAVSGQDSGVEVRPGQEEVISSAPGQIVSSSFRISNTSGRSLYLMPELRLPEGWKQVLKDYAFDLAADASEIRLVSFFVPRRAAPGDYEIVYRVSGREYPSYSDEYSLKVRVQAHKKLAINLLQADDFTIAGETTEFLLQIVNESNFGGTVHVGAVCHSGEVVAVEPENVHLEPGQSREAAVTVKTDPRQSYTMKMPVQFTAELASDRGITAEVSHLLDIIPRISGKADRYHRLPVDISLRGVTYTREESKGAVQGEISGAGPLDEAGRHRLMLNLRGPDIYGMSVYAQRNRVFAGYEHENLRVYAGDRPYSLSALTERARYGRGTELAADHNKWTLGGYYFTSLWRQAAMQQKAVYLHYAVSDLHRIKLNVLDKRGGDGRGSIVSVESDVQFMKKSTITGEFATAGVNGERENACNIKCSGTYGPADYFLNVVNADKHFPGYYRDTKFVTANLGVSLMENLQLRASVRRDRQNFAMDTTRISAPLTVFNQAGVKYKIGNRLNLSLDLVKASREDRMPQPRFAYSESFTRFTLGFSPPHLSFQFRGELGTTRNFLTDKRFGSHKLSASVYYRTAGSLMLRAYVDYSRNSRYSDALERRMTLGTSLNLKLRTGTALDLSYQNNFSPEEYFRDRNLFEIKIKQHLFGSHVVSLKARQTLVRNSFYKKDVAAIAEYTLPLGVPVSRRSGNGSLNGFVFNMEEGRPVSNAVVTVNGIHAVTDKNGRYTFPALKAGDYYVTIDKQQLGMKYTAAEKLPGRITIAEGSAEKMNFHIVRSAAISGSILLYGFAGDSLAGDIYTIVGAGQQEDDTLHSEQQYKPAGKLGGVVVDLERDDDKQRRISAPDGSFSFEDLRPGRWTMRVSSRKLPEYHYLETAVFDILLEPGGHVQQLVRVLPRKRTLKLIEDGGILELGTENRNDADGKR